MQRRVLSVLAVGGALAATLAACSSAGSSAGSSASPASDQQHQADLYGIEQIEVNWHKASSTKDLDLMMSQWADNATFTIGTQTYTGKDQIRNFFVSTAAPFKAGNTWVSDTPAYKIVATVDGDKGTLYFECHYVDPKTGKVVRDDQ